MTAGSAASRRVLARTPVAPLPASSPTRPTGITGRMSAPPETSSPEVCSFRLPLTTPGATSTASGLVSRCPRPGGLYDGDDEASRVPGKPTRTHATRSDSGEVAAFTASETRRDDLPSNTRRRPSHSMHFGAQSRGLRAPCERFAPWVTQAHASLGSGWRPTLAGWDWIPTGFRTRFRRSHHVILSPLTGLSRHTRWCTNTVRGFEAADQTERMKVEGSSKIQDEIPRQELGILRSNSGSPRRHHHLVISGGHRRLGTGPNGHTGRAAEVLGPRD